MIVPGMKTRLKVLMAERDLVRRQVAEDTGLSSATITKVIQGRNVYVETLFRLCRYFNVSLSELVTYNGDADIVE